MIFFGKSKNSYKKYGISFVRTSNRVYENICIPHYYLDICFGNNHYWVGYNRLKRIIKGQLYSLDGKELPYNFKKEIKWKKK